MPERRKYFTTPIYYVNDKPHIGSAYCTLATDTIARFWREKIGKENVFFLTGTDENSQKSVDAAAKAGEEIHAYLDKMAQRWRDTWDEIGVSYDDFIRTTEERHTQTVQKIFAKIFEKDDIYKGKYEGKYCTGCEAFLKDADLDESGHCPAHKTKPQLLSEDNYFFRLSKYQQPLLDWYKENPSAIEPASRRNEILSFIRSGLEDVSISRESADFGIPLPVDPKQKVYVWFDALINYYSAIQEKNREIFWSHAEHIVGKDITKFHCVIWPAMLMSAEIPLYQNVFAHGFFTVDGQKMSKSLGNVVDPVELAQKYGRDALRVGLLGSFEFGNDGDFLMKNFDDFYRTKLAGGIGNLYFRVITLWKKFYPRQSPEVDNFSENFRENFEKAFTDKALAQAIHVLESAVEESNRLLNASELWVLVKNDSDAAAKIFAKIFFLLHEIGFFSRVLLPDTAPKIQQMLNDIATNQSPEILFPHVETSH